MLPHAPQEKSQHPHLHRVDIDKESDFTLQLLLISLKCHQPVLGRCMHKGRLFALGRGNNRGAKLGHSSLAQATEQGSQKRDQVPPSPAGHHAGSEARPVASRAAPPCSRAVLSQAEETAAPLRTLKPALLPVPSTM